MGYESVKNSRAKLKERIVYVMGGKCKCCGYNRCIKALELHHLNPEEKEITISKNTNQSWAKVKEELPKTILVCANCHREIHDGIIKNQELSSSYDKNRAIEIDKEIELLKKKEINYCKVCGKIINSKAEKCVHCNNLARRVVKDRPTRDELKNLIRTQPFTTIAAQYGVTDNSIRKWCDFYNLPRRKSDINNYSNSEWEFV